MSATVDEVHVRLLSEFKEFVPSQKASRVAVPEPEREEVLKVVQVGVPVAERPVKAVPAPQEVAE